jgi:hypothetical protein
MIINRQSRKIFLFRNMTMAVMITLAILTAASPQPAQAATTCQTYHWVREGDTTPYIAHTYLLKWREIAEANDLDIGEKPEVGQRLCIPAVDEESSKTEVVQPVDEEKANITVNIFGGRIYLSLSKFKSGHVYLVKARDAEIGVGGWQKMDRVKIEKKESYDLSFSVPKALRDVRVLNVCLKDQSSDELICRANFNR